MEDAATDITTGAPSAEASTAPASATPEAGLAGAGADSTAAKDAPAQAGEAKPQEAKTNEWLGAPEGGYNQDGVDVPAGLELNEETCEALAGVCKDLGLSQKSFATIINRVGPILQQQEAQVIESFRADNLKAFAADKELGGANAQKTLAAANKAYEKYCSEDLKDLFKQTGLNTHPAIIRLFHSLSQMMAEDTTPRGNGGSHGYDVRQFFKNSNMN